MLFTPVLILLVASVVFMALHRRTRSRHITALLSVTAVAYMLVIILPFFAYGLHLEDPARVAGGVFDPKGYPLFSSESNIGSWLHFIALLLLLVTPVAIVALGIRLAVSVKRHWRGWQTASRTGALTVLLVSAALFSFMWTPFGRVILAWHLD